MRNGDTTTDMMPSYLSLWPSSLTTQHQPHTSPLTWAPMASLTTLSTTDLRPDIVWWDDSVKKILLIELTVCFESSFKHAAERKMAKYEARSAGYSGQVITLEVGSRGIIGDGGFSCLRKEFRIKDKDHLKLFINLSRMAIGESYKIW